VALEEVNVGKQPVTIYHSDGTSTIEMKECVDYHATGKDVQALKGLGRKAGEQKSPVRRGARKKNRAGTRVGASLRNLHSESGLDRDDPVWRSSSRSRSVLDRGTLNALEQRTKAAFREVQGDLPERNP